MTPEQERAEFEAWANTQADKWLIVGGLTWSPGTNDYASARTNAAWAAWQAGRAALQSQPLTVDALAQEIRRANGNHTLGAGALAEALTPFLQSTRQSQDAEDAERLDWMEALGSVDIVKTLDGKTEVYAPDYDLIYATGTDLREAIDHARRIEGEGDD